MFSICPPWGGTPVPGSFTGLWYPSPGGTLFPVPDGGGGVPQSWLRRLGTNNGQVTLRAVSGFPQEDFLVDFSDSIKCYMHIWKGHSVLFTQLTFFLTNICVNRDDGRKNVEFITNNLFQLIVRNTHTHTHLKSIYYYREDIQRYTICSWSVNSIINGLSCLV